MRRLVVTADDLGLTSGVVTGIGDAFRKGIVTSTSLMINAPAAEEAFALARQEPKLSVGLHFVLTFGRPVGRVDPLAAVLNERGDFVRLESSSHETLAVGAVAGELEAQLERFVEGVGRAPSHIDGHHHVHALPNILPAVLDASRRLGIPFRAPDAASQRKAEADGAPTTGRFIEAFYGANEVSVEKLRILLESLDEGTSELMCHPAHIDDELARVSSYVKERQEELATLTEPAVRRAIDELGIELTAIRRPGALTS